MDEPTLGAAARGWHSLVHAPELLRHVGRGDLIGQD